MILHLTVKIFKTLDMYKTIAFFVLSVFSHTSLALDISVDANCINCEAAGDNQTVDLLFRRDTDADVTIEWTLAGEIKNEDKAGITLHAYNPALEAAFKLKADFSLVQTDTTYTGRYTFSPKELGDGTFITVLKTKKDQILDWRAWRLQTVQQYQGEITGPVRASNWELDLRPSAINIVNGGRSLPSGNGGDVKAWWSLANQQSFLNDIDLDGQTTGAPGLGVVWSPTWHSRGETFVDKVRNQITRLKGHRVRFGELEWTESKDRRVDLQGYGEEQDTLRHYYTVITLFTNASIKTFDARDVDGKPLFSDPTYFSHETRARLKKTKDPRFWSTYSLREYGNDAIFLDHLADQFKKDKLIPGLRNISTDDGDGGATDFNLGFQADILPWKSSDAVNFYAGFVALDVIAVRKGIGNPIAEGYSGEGGLGKAWCKVVGCESDSTNINLSNAPEGYRALSPLVSLSTVEGSIPIIDTFSFAKRGDGDNSGLNIKFPEQVNFAIGAKMRSGALIKETGWRKQFVSDIIPINVYAQYVLRMTVGLTEEASLVVSDAGPVLPEPISFQPEITVEAKELTLIDNAVAFFQSLQRWVLLLLIVGLLLFVPSFLSLLSAFFQLVANIIQMLNRFIQVTVLRRYP